MVRTTTASASVPARPKNSVFIPVCLAAMVAAAAVSVAYAAAQEGGPGAGGMDRQDQIIEDRS